MYIEIYNIIIIGIYDCNTIGYDVIKNEHCWRLYMCTYKILTYKINIQLDICCNFPENMLILTLF